MRLVSRELIEFVLDHVCKVHLGVGVREVVWSLARYCMFLTFQWAPRLISYRQRSYRNQLEESWDENFLYLRDGDSQGVQSSCFRFNLLANSACSRILVSPRLHIVALRFLRPSIASSEHRTVWRAEETIRNTYEEQQNHICHRCVSHPYLRTAKPLQHSPKLLQLNLTKPSKHL